MSTTEIGKLSEETVAKLLESKGYKILGQNWRSRWCEIDIIAKNNKTIYYIYIQGCYI